jgi:hypothetical protein
VLRGGGIAQKSVHCFLKLLFYAKFRFVQDQTLLTYVIFKLSG